VSPDHRTIALLHFLRVGHGRRCRTLLASQASGQSARPTLWCAALLGRSDVLVVEPVEDTGPLASPRVFPGGRLLRSLLVVNAAPPPDFAIGAGVRVEGLEQFSRNPSPVVGIVRCRLSYPTVIHLAGNQSTVPSRDVPILASWVVRALLAAPSPKPGTPQTLLGLVPALGLPAASDMRVVPLWAPDTRELIWLVGAHATQEIFTIAGGLRQAPLALLEGLEGTAAARDLLVRLALEVQRAFAHRWSEAGDTTTAYPYELALSAPVFDRVATTLGIPVPCSHPPRAGADPDPTVPKTSIWRPRTPGGTSVGFPRSHWSGTRTSRVRLVVRVSFPPGFEGRVDQLIQQIHSCIAQTMSPDEEFDRSLPAVLGQDNLILLGPLTAMSVDDLQALVWGLALTEHEMPFGSPLVRTAVEVQAELPIPHNSHPSPGQTAPPPVAPHFLHGLAELLHLAGLRVRERVLGQVFETARFHGVLASHRAMLERVTVSATADLQGNAIEFATLLDWLQLLGVPSADHPRSAVDEFEWAAAVDEVRRITLSTTMADPDQPVDVEAGGRLAVVAVAGLTRGFGSVTNLNGHILLLADHGTIEPSCSGTADRVIVRAEPHLDGGPEWLFTLGAVVDARFDGIAWRDISKGGGEDSLHHRIATAWRQVHATCPDWQPPTAGWTLGELLANLSLNLTEVELGSYELERLTEAFAEVLAEVAADVGAWGVFRSFVGARCDETQLWQLFIMLTGPNWVRAIRLSAADRHHGGEPVLALILRIWWLCRMRWSPQEGRPPEGPIRRDLRRSCAIAMEHPGVLTISEWPSVGETLQLHRHEREFLVLLASLIQDLGNDAHIIAEAVQDLYLLSAPDVCVDAPAVFSPIEDRLSAWESLLWNLGQEGALAQLQQSVVPSNEAVRTEAWRRVDRFVRLAQEYRALVLVDRADFDSGRFWPPTSFGDAPEKATYDPAGRLCLDKRQREHWTTLLMDFLLEMQAVDLGRSVQALRDLLAAPGSSNDRWTV